MLGFALSMAFLWPLGLTFDHIGAKATSTIGAMLCAMAQVCLGERFHNGIPQRKGMRDQSLLGPGMPWGPWAPLGPHHTVDGNGLVTIKGFHLKSREPKSSTKKSLFLHHFAFLSLDRRDIQKNHTNFTSSIRQGGVLWAQMSI